jgi:hypothetical protein
LFCANGLLVILNPALKIEFFLEKGIIRFFDENDISSEIIKLQTRCNQSVGWFYRFKKLH